MRLLTYDVNGELCMTKDLADKDVQPYAILSHTWAKDNEEEVTLREAGTTAGRQKPGYRKIDFCGRRAQQDGWSHFWVDTCCIDKSNHVELSRAITSMYRWYQKARVCYVYLADVLYCQEGPATTTSPLWEASFCQSRWFTRGWTLQELLAPSEVVVYSREGNRLGTKSELRDLLSTITGIPVTALDGQPLSDFPTIERMRWTRGRQTTEKEDQAYCLLGIFEVYMPLIYGEGNNAFRRLQKEIDDRVYSDPSRQLPEVRHLGLCLTSAPLTQPHEFIGRATEIQAIHDILRPDGLPSPQRRAVLGGIGGVGKTQLAIAYAYRHQQKYTSVLWLNASSEVGLYISLRSIIGSLATTDEALNNEQLLAQFHRWLSHSRNTQWLLIFDNYDEPDQFNIYQFYPTIGHGSIIVTTRLPNKVSGSLVRVQPFTAIDDSFDILQIRSGRRDIKKDIGARLLAERMAGFPLALVTAGAFLRKSTLSFQQYLDIYEQQWQVDRRRPLYLHEYTDRTLYTTWNITYDRLNRDDPEAARMMTLLAYFDNQEVWYELPRAGLSSQSPAWLSECIADQISFESVMSRLVEYCLVEARQVSQTYSIYSMHKCVHDWALGALNQDVDSQLYWYAFDCVAASIDRNDSEALGQVRYSRLSRHAVHLTHHRFQTYDEESTGLVEHLNEAVWIADMLNKQVQLEAAEQMYNRALAGCEKALGPDHPDTLGTVNNLGYLYYTQGKLEAAEQMYSRALAGYEKALGPDHTDTLGTVNNLGILYSNQGKLEAAEQMYSRALAGYDKALGPNHTDTLRTVNNLGVLYCTQDKLEVAEQMYSRVLAGYEKALGRDHSSTQYALRNLDFLHRSQGWLDKLALSSSILADARANEVVTDSNESRVGKR